MFKAVIVCVVISFAFAQYQQGRNYEFHNERAAAAPAYRAPPAQQYSPPAQQYSPPAPQYSPPAQQYSPSAQQYSPPAQQYSPPSQQYSPPAQQYRPPPQQYSPPAQQYRPAPQAANRYDSGQWDPKKDDPYYQDGPAFIDVERLSYNIGTSKQS